MPRCIVAQMCQWWCFFHEVIDLGATGLQENFIVDLIYEYLPSIVITLANFITPLLFSVIINYEDYSPAFEIRFTLMRYTAFQTGDLSSLFMMVTK